MQQSAESCPLLREVFVWEGTSRVVRTAGSTSASGFQGVRKGTATWALGGAGCLTCCMAPAAAAQHPPVCGVFFSVSSVYPRAGRVLKASPSWEGLAACPGLSHQPSSPFVCLGGTSEEPEYVEPWGRGSQALLGTLAHPHQGFRAGPALHSPRRTKKSLQGFRAFMVRNSP